MECDYIKGHIEFSLKFVLFATVMLLIIAPSFAHEKGISAYNVEITKDYVKATGVCSCSLMKNRRHHTVIFKNYCPNCHHYGCLTFEQGPSSWTCPEGMWYCTRCDMDFCLAHGKSHDSRGFYLVPYNGIIDEYIIKNGYLTKQKVQYDTANKNQTVVQAQTIEEYTELIVGNQKYRLKKTELDEFKNSFLKL